MCRDVVRLVNPSTLRATRISVGISSVAAADLDTNPSEQCRVARTVPGSLWMVRNTILVRCIFRILDAAVTPFIPGILMSRRTISGFNFNWPTFSMASLPSLASPHTWKEFKSSSDRIAVRAAELSSTTSIRAANSPLLGPTATDWRGRKAPRGEGYSLCQRSVSSIPGRPGETVDSLAALGCGGYTTDLSSRKEEITRSVGLTLFGQKTIDRRDQFFSASGLLDEMAVSEETGQMSGFF